MSSCWYPYLKWSHTVTNICCSQVHLEIGKLCSLCRCWMKHWPMVSWDTSLSCNVKIRKPAAAVWSGSIVKSWLAWTLKTRRCFSSYSEWLQRSGCVCDCNAVADFECFSLLFFIFLVLSNYSPLLCNWRLLQSEIPSCQISHSACCRFSAPNPILLRCN